MTLYPLSFTTSVRCALIVGIVLLAGCGVQPWMAEYHPQSPDAAVRAWTDAYNAKRFDQLALLMHPKKRDVFLENGSTVQAELKTWRVDRFKMGGEIDAAPGVKGRVARLGYHDGRRGSDRELVVVKFKGQWWVWRH